MRSYSFLSVAAAAFALCQPVYAADNAGLPKNEVSISVEGDVRIIRANGIPDHETGQFPGRGNPNRISAQKYEYRVPADPKPADHTTALRMQSFGIAVNGVVFDPGAAEWWNGDRAWQYEAMGNGVGFLGTDSSNAHVQPTGAYHYHGIPKALLQRLTGGQEKMVLVGWAADGFPIYNDLGHADANDAKSPLKKVKSSYRVKSGERPGGPGGKHDGKFVADYEYAAGTGDLDECNGRTAPTPEYPKGIYHYVLTDQFPFIPRMYRGTPDPSFNRRGPGANPQFQDGPGRPGQGRPGQPGQGADGPGPNGPPNGPGPNGPDGGGPGQQNRPIPAIVRAIDLNGDGIIDADEIAKAAESLKKLDRNNDGQLTRDEYLGPRPQQGPGGQGPGGQGPGGQGQGPAQGPGGQSSGGRGPGRTGGPDGPPPGGPGR